MHGGGIANTSIPDDLQEEVLDRIFYLSELAGDRDDTGPIPTPEAALRELLRGRSEHSTPDVPLALAPFNLGRVSLPHTLADAPFAADLLEGHARQYLDVPEQMLRPDPPCEEVFRPYWDPRLLNDKGAYRSLIRRLHKLGYLRYTTQPKGEVGIFFVWKSDGEHIRMILDARGPNRVFRDPLGVELCTAEGFSCKDKSIGARKSLAWIPRVS